MFAKAGDLQLLPGHQKLAVGLSAGVRARVCVSFLSGLIFSDVGIRPRNINVIVMMVT